MKRETLLNAARMGRGVISLDVRLMDDVATPPPLPHQSTKPQKKTKKRTRQHARSATKRWDAQFFFYLIFFFDEMITTE